MKRIVLVEDERDILDVLEFNFRSAGFEVESATTGRAGLALIERSPPDLLILDLMLPDVSGQEVCRIVRSSPRSRNTPILILSALSAEIDKVVGFEIGADDYVTKPFSVRELLLRTRGLLRRTEKPAGVPEEALLFGQLRIAPQAHRVWVAEKEVHLTALEFQLLLTLLERRNRVQSRSVLLEHVWGLRSDITTRTVDVHVKRLREKLGDARHYVETVRGVGYRFSETPRESEDHFSTSDMDEPFIHRERLYRSS